MTYLQNLNFLKINSLLYGNYKTYLNVRSGVSAEPTRGDTMVLPEHCNLYTLPVAKVNFATVYLTKVNY